MKEEMMKEVAPSEETETTQYAPLTEAQLKKLCDFFGCTPETLGEMIDGLQTEEEPTEEETARSMFPSLNE